MSAPLTRKTQRRYAAIVCALSPVAATAFALAAVWGEGEDRLVFIGGAIAFVVATPVFAAFARVMNDPAWRTTPQPNQPAPTTEGASDDEESA